jgi:hypothetical protein
LPRSPRGRSAASARTATCWACGPCCPPLHRRNGPCICSWTPRRDALRAVTGLQ